ncbi:hypothetical protein B0T11DRAFT_13887 [Plectosphaerella cucumerina]|uniref:Uncharacterized protein n=1 Tax=Plectosphaerella cucumerina TaxID=40658 RepID=A0A8K0TR65_9PEZI|nr:hypothetical protein B0T11DRAFT_13887 [Plectosphaerella cucumerina]
MRWIGGLPGGKCKGRRGRREKSTSGTPVSLDIVKRPSGEDRWPNVVRRCDSGEASWVMFCSGETGATRDLESRECGGLCLFKTGRTIFQRERETAAAAAAAVALPLPLPPRRGTDRQQTEPREDREGGQRGEPPRAIEPAARRGWAAALPTPPSQMVDERKMHGDACAAGEGEGSRGQGYVHHSQQMPVPHPARFSSSSSSSSCRHWRERGGSLHVAAAAAAASKTAGRRDQDPVPGLVSVLGLQSRVSVLCCADLLLSPTQTARQADGISPSVCFWCGQASD